MVTKLKNMKLTSVDLVRAGANQEADIGLFKSAGPQAEYDEALVKSARSILEDPGLTEDQQAGMLAKSVDDYRAALEEPEEPEGEEVMVEKEPEEEAPEDLDEIEEVEKSAFTSGDQYDMITEVRKFNPFHDALGRFASKNGFKTYSANPKMKVAQPSIIRSAQAGHGKTMNVHTESKGENIGQNYDWLQTGQKPASTVSTPPAKPSKPKAEPAETPKDSGSIAEAVKDVSLSSSQKLALQARDENGHACDTKKIAEDFDGVRVEGKDISGSFDYSQITGGGTAIDAVVRAQGWDKAPPTVISDREAFDKLCLQNGRVMARSVHESDYTTDGKFVGGGKVSAEEVAKATMTQSDIALGADGGAAYGGGLYLVDTYIKPGQSPKSMAQNISLGQSESFDYANKWSYKEGVQMMATPRPGARIATPKETQSLDTEFSALSWSEKAKFGNDVGAYIASKGYDGAKWHSDSNSTAYTTIYNKSALVFFSEGAFRSDMNP